MQIHSSLSFSPPGYTGSNAASSAAGASASSSSPPPPPALQITPAKLSATGRDPYPETEQLMGVRIGTKSKAADLVSNDVAVPSNRPVAGIDGSGGYVVPGTASSATFYVNYDPSVVTPGGAMLGNRRILMLEKPVFSSSLGNMVITTASWGDVPVRRLAR